MPALVGEITIGILAGPHFGNLVPETDALMLEGELALVNQLHLSCPCRAGAIRREHI